MEPDANIPATWLEKVITRLSQPRLMWFLALMFILLLVAVLYLDGTLRSLRDLSFLRLALIGPAIFLYTLLVSRLLDRSGEKAIAAFRPLMSLDEAEFQELVAESAPIAAWREWLALAVGAAFAFLVAGPWNWPGGFSWLELYSLMTNTLMFGLLAWISYRSLAETRLLAELHRHPLDIDIFDPAPLEPVARHSLATSLAFIGGITLSLFFLPQRGWLLSIQSMILYSILILVSVLVFFVTMNNTHQVMADTKEHELKQVRQNLSSAYRELKERAAEGRLQDMEALSDSITAWLAYEKRIEQAPEWPYTTDTLRNLLMSTLLPVVAWASQVIVEFIA